MLTILFALLALMPAEALGDGSPDLVTQVRLRSTVRLQADQSALTLGDLATIKGPQAQTLQSLAITHLSLIHI